MIGKSTVILIYLSVAVLAICIGTPLYASWQLELYYQNFGTGGALISSSAILGEHPNALDAYDWNYDIPLGPPPQNPGYLRIYFPHADWYPYNGNYGRDIRSTTVIQKSWNITLQQNAPLSSNYALSWIIPNTLPAYYQPKLLISNSTIDMRSHASYTWTGIKNSCSVCLDIVPGYPYLLAAPPDLFFANLQPQRLNLRRYFGITSGALSFAYSPDPNLIQSIVTENDSIYWQVQPLSGWTGTTTIILSATGSAGTVTSEVEITCEASSSPPQAPQNVHISLSSPDSLCLGWDPVSLDTEGNPITNISYRVTAYSDAECQQQLFSFVVQQPDICMLINQPLMFFRIYAIKE